MLVCWTRLFRRYIVCRQEHIRRCRLVTHIDASPSCTESVLCSHRVVGAGIVLLVQSIVHILASSIIFHIGIVAILHCIFLPAMSHHAMCASSKPRRPRCPRIRTKRAVFDFGKIRIVEEAMSHTAQHGKKLRLGT